MNVSLTPELKRLVQEKVESGAYQSASDVVRAALRALAERDAVRAQCLADLRKELQQGIDQYDRGERITVEVDEVPAYMRSLEARARKRLIGRRPKK